MIGIQRFLAKETGTKRYPRGYDGYKVHMRRIANSGGFEDSVVTEFVRSDQRRVGDAIRSIVFGENSGIIDYTIAPYGRREYRHDVMSKYWGMLIDSVQDYSIQRLNFSERYTSDNSIHFEKEPVVSE